MKWNKWQLVLILFVVAGCHRAKNKIPETMLSGTAVIASDEALMPLINAEIDVFQSIYNYASIDCKFGSEYDAINLLLQEKTRLAIIARPLNEEESASLKSKSLIPESIPLAYDAIALIVRSEHQTLALSMDQISQLMSGKITDWNQLDKSVPSSPIKLVFDAESSGVLRYLNEKLNLNRKVSGDITFAGDSQKVIEMVAANANAIGFVGYNWLSELENLKVQETLTKISLVAVSASTTTGTSNSYIPSLSSLYNNTYPLIRRVYAIYTDPAASLARGFLSHLTSEKGQKIIYRFGLKPESDFQRLISTRKEKNTIIKDNIK
jgi:phosphate transport system substrate-binding protein